MAKARAFNRSNDTCTYHWRGIDSHWWGEVKKDAIDQRLPLTDYLRKAVDYYRECQLGG